jgi:hypothetical protein
LRLTLEIFFDKFSGERKSQIGSLAYFICHEIKNLSHNINTVCELILISHGILCNLFLRYYVI